MRTDLKGIAMSQYIYYGDHHNCTEVDQQVKHYFLPVAYAIIFVVGLVGNVTSIGIYVAKLRPWKSSSIIMVNLAVTDLLHVLSLPFLVYYYSNLDSWTLGDFLCRFVRFGFHFNLYGSILFLMCHAVFRFVVVMRPLWTAQLQKKIWGIVACSVVWVVAAAEIIPMLNMISMEEHNNKTYCLDFASTIPVEDVRLYGWLLSVIGFLLPLVVVFMCHIGIVIKLAKGPYAQSPSRTRARRVTVLILLVFVVCFLPYHILRVLRIETRWKDTPCFEERVVHAAYIVSRPLAAFNTFFNLALYTLSGDQFQTAFKSSFNWKRWLTKSKTLCIVATISKESSDLPVA